MIDFKEKIIIGGFRNRLFLYSADGGDVSVYKKEDAASVAARLIDTYAYLSIRVEIVWERDDYRKYNLPPPPPEHEFDINMDLSMSITLQKKSRFNEEGFQELPETFIALLPEEVRKHLWATEKQIKYIKSLGGNITKYTTKREASWYIKKLLRSNPERVATL